MVIKLNILCKLQIDPYHGNQQQLPEPEDFELPDNIDMDGDEGNDEKVTLFLNFTLFSYLINRFWFIAGETSRN